MRQKGREVPVGHVGPAVQPSINNLLAPRPEVPPHAQDLVGPAIHPTTSLATAQKGRSAGKVERVGKAGKEARVERVGEQFHTIHALPLADEEDKVGRAGHPS